MMIEMTTAAPGDEEDLHRQLLQLPGQRRDRLVLVLEHVRDVADLGRHPGRGDDEQPVPRVTFVFMKTMSVRSPSGVSGALDRVHRLRDRQALARQRRLGDLERRRLEQPPVGGDDVAGLDRDDVAGHELRRIELDELPVAANARLDEHHLLERRDGGGRLPLLLQAEERVEDGEEEDDDAGPVLVQRPDAPDADDEQDDLHHVAVLAEERAPVRLRLRLVELVRAVQLQPRRGLDRGEPLRRVHLERREHLVGVEGVPDLLRAFLLCGCHGRHASLLQVVCRCGSRGRRKSASSTIATTPTPTMAPNVSGEFSIVSATKKPSTTTITAMLGRMITGLLLGVVAPPPAGDADEQEDGERDGAADRRDRAEVGEVRDRAGRARS